MKRIHILIIYSIAWVFYHFRFRGSTLLLRYLFTITPFYPLSLRHPLGFIWKIDSKESLWTYLSSCESFTSKVIMKFAYQLEASICVGANRGWYPLVIRKMNSNCEIHAFEPNSETFELLVGNLKANTTLVYSHNFALGRSSSFRDIYSYENGNDGMTTLYPSSNIADSFSRLETIRVRTLDEFFPLSCKMPEPILLQMDIEGAEYDALLGSTQFLNNYTPIVICEINPVLLEAAGCSSFELFHFMDTLGYAIYWIDERGKLWLQKEDEPCEHLRILPPGSGSNYIFLKDSAIKRELVSTFGTNS